MKIKVDENLPKSILAILVDSGNDAMDVYSQGMSGWKDDDLWSAIQIEDRFLITADKGFADIRKYKPGSHAGVLLLRPDQDGIKPLTDLLNRVLQTVEISSLASTITVATSANLRIRRKNL